MFAFRPFWRWQTQGTFAMGFNAIMNWNDLDAGQVGSVESRQRGARRGRESWSRFLGGNCGTAELQNCRTTELLFLTRRTQRKQRDAEDNGTTVRPGASFHCQSFLILRFPVVLCGSALLSASLRQAPGFCRSARFPPRFEIDNDAESALLSL